MRRGAICPSALFNRIGPLLITLGLHALLFLFLTAAFRIIFDRPAKEAAPTVVVLSLTPVHPAPVAREQRGDADRARPAERPTASVEPVVVPSGPSAAVPELIGEEPVVGASAVRSDTDVPMDAERYRKSLRDRIEQARHYPVEALRKGQQGTALVAFSLHRDGAVSDLAIARSSGRARLDQAARDAVLHAAPFPAIPQDLPDSLDITVPVVFTLAAGGRQQMAARVP